MIALNANNITKVYPGVVALNSVNVEFETGKIHCIIGENGSGKSTLIKSLTGIETPDRGEVYVAGQNTREHPEAFARIAYVPQEINLFPHLSAAENLFMPFKGEERGFISRKKINAEATKWFERFNLHITPDTIVSDSSVSEQQLLQIIRAVVNSNFDILILDEPTTSLTTRDTQILFSFLEELKKNDVAIVFISHKLEEIFAIGDRITVLRNGNKIDEAAIADVDYDWIITRMTGRNIIQDEEFRSKKVGNTELLKVQNLTGPGFSDVSFSLYQGEILGFAGLVGSGRSELLQGIFGYLPVYSGNVEFEGRPWTLGDTTLSTKRSLIYLPEERKSQGILPLMDVAENITVSILDKLRRALLISDKKKLSVSKEIVRDYDIKTSSLSQKVKFLSGGNQQKVIIGRAMATNPRVLIFDEPTKGIDVGAKFEIYKMMQTLAEEGIGIILISSEIEEVMKCSNRIITMYHGRKQGEFPGETKKDILLASMLGAGNNGRTE